MMNTLNVINNSILIKPIHGGPIDTGVSINEKGLVDGLKENSKFNYIMLSVIMALIVITFAVICYFIWRAADNITLIISLIGGEGASLIFLINLMRNIYRDKVASDLLILTIPSLQTTEEKLALISTIKMFIESPKK